MPVLQGNKALKSSDGTGKFGSVRLRRRGEAARLEKEAVFSALKAESEFS
jgi:hypothetical protein